MSVETALHEALVLALRGRAAITDALSGVFDAPPARAALPHAVVSETVFSDWSTKDAVGREGRIAVLLYDGGERPTRLRALTSEIEAAIEAMPRDLASGWRIASLAFVRSRIVADGDRRWLGASEFRVRMLRSN